MALTSLEALTARVFPIVSLVLNLSYGRGLPPGEHGFNNKGTDTYHDAPQGSVVVFPYMNCPPRYGVGPGGTRRVQIGANGEPIYNTSICLTPEDSRPKGSGPAEK